jgi:hypothetical protein
MLGVNKLISSGRPFYLRKDNYHTIMIQKKSASINYFYNQRENMIKLFSYK